MVSWVMVQNNKIRLRKIKELMGSKVTHLTGR